MTGNIWFSDLFEDHYALLYRIGRAFFGASHAQAEIIEDQIQQTFLLAWKNEQKLKGHANPTGWLVVTFRHCLMDECRRLGRKRGRELFSLDEDDRPDIADSTIPPLESFVQGAQSKALLIKLLGESDATLFLRYCVEGESAKTLAQDYHMSETNVRVRISRLKKKLLLNKELFLCIVSLLMIGMNAGGSL
ncbi:MAG: sigma-70 family RNA polymerase sigma factor [Clostridiales bacterium]|nr:sigma-70 family RNA polymerase sigma factor [Clostridiales bacterium]